MILKHFYEASIAQSSYLIGCAATGQALVIDPIVDVRPYVEAAAAEGLRITGVAETHIHADFVSGARALAAAVGATLHVSGEGGPDWQYGFAGEPGVQVVHHGDVIEIGNVALEVVHTPGHTPEHLMYVLTDRRASSVPLGAFTGDFLFVGDVGRPDLLETAAGQVGTMEASARRLFSSLQTLEPLPEHLLIWPGHGSGSACGKNLGGVPVSSLGYERLANWALRETHEQAFVASVLADQPDPPMYFGEMKQLNKRGADAWSAVPALPAVDLNGVRTVVAAGALSVDVRSEGARGTLPGAIAIPMDRSFSAWAGSVVPPSQPFVIVARDEIEANAARRALALVGRGAAEEWIAAVTLEQYGEAGGHLESLDVVARPEKGQAPVDVRSSAEWRGGHLEGAVHVPLARLPERTAGLDRSARLLVYCQFGLRSVVAATALRRLGFVNVSSLEGGLNGYRKRLREEARVA
jgi:hydroxyacylglutathione hydrolase